MIQAENEDKLKELEGFNLWNYLSSFVDIGLFGNKAYLKDGLEPDSSYNSTNQSCPLFFRGDLVQGLSQALESFVWEENITSSFSPSNNYMRSSLFFCLTGIIIMLLHILIRVVSRLVSKKRPVYFTVVGSWSFSVYCGQLVFRNLQMICKLFWEYLLGYLVIVQQIGIALIINWKRPVLWAYSYYRRKVYTAIKKPGLPHLLTEKEYWKQGEVETCRGLEELREFCNSREYSALKAVSRVQSNKRFDDFRKGAPHLMPNEISDHQKEYRQGGIWEKFSSVVINSLKRMRKKMAIKRRQR